MKALVVDENHVVQDLFEVALEFKLRMRVFGAVNDLEAIEKLKSGNKFDIIICGIPGGGNIQNLLNTLDENEIKIPVLFTASNENISQVAKYIPYHPLCGRVSYNQDEGVLASAVKRLLNVQRREVEARQGYCSLPLRHFLKFKESPCDLFVRIGEEKYVKIFSSGTALTEEDVRKYESKDCFDFHMKAADYLTLSDKIIKNLSKALDSKKLNTKQLSSVSLFAHHSAAKAVEKLGLTSEVLNMANVAMESASKAIKTSSNLSKLLKNLQHKNDYISEHTLMLTFVSTAVAKEMSWASETTNIKLCLASFFHDITLTDPVIAQYGVPTSKPEQFLKSKEIANYNKHPMDAADLLNNVSGLPPDVDTIIRQHHEKPDGSGFPRGLDHTVIFSLAAVFIVAEEFVNQAFSQGIEQFVVDDIIENMEEHYVEGNFLLAMESLKKVFCYIPKVVFEDGDTKEENAS